MKLSNLWRKLSGSVETEDKLNSFLKEITGLIHIGASTGAERKLYAGHGLEVIWVEPLEDIFEALKKNISPFPQQKALRYLVTDCDDREYGFHISSNNGASSSIMEPSLHKEVWPHVTFNVTLLLRSITFQTLVEREHVDPKRYQGLVLDTQGSELLVLKGAGDLLAGFSFIKTEAADFESYTGCCTIDELAEYLGGYGFRELHRKPFNSKPAIGTYYDVLFGRHI